MSHHDADHHNDEQGEHHVHVIPFVPMLVIFIALLILTVLTVWVAKIPMSEFWHAASELFIAVIKAALVFAYFMHLKYDKPLNTVVLASCVLGVLLFIGFSMLDIAGRGPLDPRVAGEIHEGGNLQLYAGNELPPYEAGNKTGRPKADMNIVDLARQYVDAKGSNPDQGDAHAENNQDHADGAHSTDGDTDTETNAPQGEPQSSEDTPPAA